VDGVERLQNHYLGTGGARSTFTEDEKKGDEEDEIRVMLSPVCLIRFTRKKRLVCKREELRWRGRRRRAINDNQDSSMIEHPTPAYNPTVPNSIPSWII